MSREEAILELIVEAALEDEPLASLVDAYIDKRLHDEDVPRFESVQDQKEWMRANLAMLYGSEIERALMSAYNHVYKRIASWSKESPFEMPDDMPEMVPREVVVAVGEALGRLDGANAVALRMEYRRTRRA